MKDEHIDSTSHTDEYYDYDITEDDVHHDYYDNDIDYANIHKLQQIKPVGRTGELKDP